jgi:hypothetical protein
MAQLRCPNCGGYRVSDQVKRIILRRTDEPAQSSWEGAGRLGLLVLGAIAIYFGTVVLLLNAVGHTGRVASADVPALFWVVFWGDLALLVIGGIMLARRRWARLGLYRGVLHRDWCRLCGYRWQWVEGQPEPTSSTGQATTDLIRRGAQPVDQAAAADPERTRRE